MLTNTGGPAFPRPTSVDATNGDLCDGSRVIGEQDGMTLRDYFAAKAMQAIIAKTPLEKLTKEQFDKSICRLPVPTAVGAYNYADAMIAARYPK